MYKENSPDRWSGLHWLPSGNRLVATWNTAHDHGQLGCVLPALLEESKLGGDTSSGRVQARASRYLRYGECASSRGSCSAGRDSSSCRTCRSAAFDRATSFIRTGERGGDDEPVADQRGARGQSIHLRFIKFDLWRLQPSAIL